MSDPLAENQTTISETRMINVTCPDFPSDTNFDWNVAVEDQALSVSFSLDAENPVFRFNRESGIWLRDERALGQSTSLVQAIEVAGWKFQLASQLIGINTSHDEFTQQVFDCPVPGGHFSHIAAFAGSLFAAINHPTRGFELHAWSDSTTGWRRILSRGADRFAANADVLCLVPGDDFLLLASGRSDPRPKWLEEGFEVLRVNSDETWDLLVGVPRVTPVGFKVPLSTRGPGFDEFQPGALCFFFRAGAAYILGTFEVNGGLKLWTSPDAISWSLDSASAEVGCLDVRKVQLVTLPDALAVVMEINHATRGHSLAVLLAEIDSV